MISGEEPVVLAHPIATGWGATTISRLLESNVGAQEGHLGFPPKKGDKGPQHRPKGQRPTLPTLGKLAVDIRDAEGRELWVYS